VTTLREPDIFRDEFWIDVTRTNGRACVTVRGEIDAYSAPVLRRELDDLTISPGILLVEVDLSGIMFVDAAAIGVLCRAHRRLEGRGGSLALVGTTPGIDRVLELAGVVRLLARPGSPATARDLRGGQWRE
jgi:anti-sigma B factor antagonist